MAKILVIEDDGLVAQTIQNLLTKAGHAVTIAVNGKAGLAAFSAQRPDLVITDIIMAEMDGLETIRALRLEAPGVPVVAMTGDGRMHDRDFLRLTLALGARELLRKPFSNEVILKAIERCLESPS